MDPEYACDKKYKIRFLSDIVILVSAIVTLALVCIRQKDNYSALAIV